MTDNERLEKLEQALRLIREVEFSYSEDDYKRKMIYRGVVHSFGLGAEIGVIMTELKNKKWAPQSNFPKQVRCIRKTGEDISVGQIYTALAKDGQIEPECYLIEANDSQEPDFYYDIDLFEDVT